MFVSEIVLQLGGISIASLKEEYIYNAILEDIKFKGIEINDNSNVKVYINLEGTAVNAYYTIDGKEAGMKTLNL